MSKNLTEVPSEEDWGDLGGDLDAKDAYRNYFGRTNADMQKFFSKDILMRAQDIRYMPRLPFIYYICGFGDYLRSQCKQDCAHIADAFIDIVEDRLCADSQAVKIAAKAILLSLKFIVENPMCFRDVNNIYGNLQARAETIQREVEQLG